MGTAPDVQFPDLVLTSPGTGKKLAGVVEVETTESVNQLEASQWADRAADGATRIEQTSPVGTAPDLQFPDLVLTSPGTGKKLAGVVEVETGESVNQLEAMAQWARFGRLPVEFVLYVPSGVAPVARRLCGDHGIGVTEIWTFHTVGDQVRFAQVHRAPLAEKLAAARAAAAEARRASAREEERRKAPAARAKARPRRAAEKPAAKAVPKRAAATPVAKTVPKRAAAKKR